jgi:predicted flap endonuclease-1-like 5' DNA nuclease
MLEKAGSAANRRALASATGISEKDLLELANRSDLARINGVGRQYANLLEDAGVDSIPELAQRNPANLLAALEKSAEASGITRKPRLEDVEDWIKQAKSLPRAVSH